MATTMTLDDLALMGRYETRLADERDRMEARAMAAEARAALAESVLDEARTEAALAHDQVKTVLAKEQDLIAQTRQAKKKAEQERAARLEAERRLEVALREVAKLAAQMCVLQDQLCGELEAAHAGQA